MKAALSLGIPMILFVAGRPDRQGPVTIVVAAYATDSMVSFDPPLPMPWDSLLPAALQPAALAADATRREEYHAMRSESGQTVVPFSLAVPLALQHRVYHLLDAAGASRIVPAGMVGTARIRWDAAAALVLSVRTGGTLYAITEGRSEGGFVLSSEGPVRLAAIPSAHTADELLAPAGQPYPYQGTSFWTIVRQYEIHQTAPTDERWVWVQWQPDTAMVEAGCSLRLALFHMTPTPVQVGSQDSGCDV